jgi:hypothetical protein
LSEKVGGYIAQQNLVQTHKSTTTKGMFEEP